MSLIPGTHGALPAAAQDALAEVVARDDPAIIGIVLTGSAARGMATVHSDVDVIVVRDETGPARTVAHSDAIDEIPTTLAELETIKPLGSEGAWDRYSYAWAQVLRDALDGRITRAVQRQAALDDQEIDGLLIGRARLDEFINFAYRCLKSHRDGRPDAARLDSAESLAALLDLVFAFQGRVRPYNKYLAWELRAHPLHGFDWQAETLLPRVNALIDGDEKVMREMYLLIEQEARAYDKRRGQTACSDVIDAWGGSNLQLLRGRAETR